MRVLLAAAEAARVRRPAALVTVIGIDGSAPRAAGARMLVYEDGAIVGTVGGGAFEHRCISAAVGIIATGRPARWAVHLTRDLGMCCGGAMEAFIEPIASREVLVVYGAGHVGAATARIANQLDFEVIVVDDRDEVLEEADLPAGARRLCADPLRTITDLPFGPHCYHLVVTHSHQLDQALLAALLPHELAWLGLIGSRSKAAKFFVRLRAAGMSEELLARANTPVGLDIGAETPAEIAVSIAAELVRVRRQHTATPRSLAEDPIPARGGDGIAHPPGLVRSSGD